MDSQKLIQVLAQMEQKLNQLRHTYEQYFLGLERREPVNLRQEVDRLFREYGMTTVQNTGLKFRLQGLTARYNSFRGRWDKQLRDLEEGHSKRDLFRAKLHERDGADVKQETPKVAKKGSPAQGAANKLFDQYVAARKKTNESVQGMTPERMQQIIKDQTKVIREKYKCKRVSFKVVVEDGKAKIKAQPKKE